MKRAPCLFGKVGLTPLDEYSTHRLPLVNAFALHQTPQSAHQLFDAMPASSPEGAEMDLREGVKFLLHDSAFALVCSPGSLEKAEDEFGECLRDFLESWR